MLINIREEIGWKEWSVKCVQEVKSLEPTVSVPRTLPDDSKKDPRPDCAARYNLNKSVHRGADIEPTWH